MFVATNCRSDIKTEIIPQTTDSDNPPRVAVCLHGSYLRESGDGCEAPEGGMILI